MKRILIVSILLMFLLCVAPAFAFPRICDMWWNGTSCNYTATGNYVLNVSFNQDVAGDNLTVWINTAQWATHNATFNGDDYWHAFAPYDEAPPFQQGMNNVTMIVHVVNPSNDCTLTCWLNLTADTPKNATETHLYLNGTEGNYTICDTSILNMTTTVNVSVVDLYIWCDENSENAGQTPLFFYSNVSDFGCYYGVEIYNITSGYEGNESFNASSVTWWLNITNDSSCYPIVEQYNLTNYTYTICSDSNILYNHYYNFVNGIANYSDVKFYCPYGCNNMTYSCELDPIQSGFLGLGIVISFIIILLLIDKWLSKGRK